jgi:uncharacterized membrane protein (DUF373 family)
VVFHDWEEQKRRITAAAGAATNDAIVVVIVIVIVVVALLRKTIVCGTNDHNELQRDSTLGFFLALFCVCVAALTFFSCGCATLTLPTKEEEHQFVVAMVFLWIDSMVRDLE